MLRTNRGNYRIYLVNHWRSELRVNRQLSSESMKEGKKITASEWVLSIIADNMAEVSFDDIRRKNEANAVCTTNGIHNCLRCLHVTLVSPIQQWNCKQFGWVLRDWLLWLKGLVNDHHALTSGFAFKYNRKANVIEVRTNSENHFGLRIFLANRWVAFKVMKTFYPAYHQVVQIVRTSLSLYIYIYIYIAIRLYRSSLLVGLLDNIQCPHGASVYWCPLENVTYEFVLNSPAVPRIFCLSWIVCEILGKWPYTYGFVWCCF